MSRLILTFAALLAVSNLAADDKPADDKPAPEEGITVVFTGTVKTGVIAIGGETTGTTITAKGVMWELDLSANKKLQKAADNLNGKLAVARGTLERRQGVEIKERWVVKVTRLRAPKSTETQLLDTLSNM
jgi:hypothetical protein